MRIHQSGDKILSATVYDKRAGRLGQCVLFPVHAFNNATARKNGSGHKTHTAAVIYVYVLDQQTHSKYLLAIT
jgi:hypothetical protein